MEGEVPHETFKVELAFKFGHLKNSAMIVHGNGVGPILPQKSKFTFNPSLSIILRGHLPHACHMVMKSLDTCHR